MSGLLAPIFRKRRRNGTTAFTEAIAGYDAADSPEHRPRLYNWQPEGDKFPLDPGSRLIGVLIRDAIQQNVSELAIVPGGFHTRILHGENGNERLLLRRFHGAFLTQRLRALCELPSARGYYPQQGSFCVRSGRTMYGILITLTITPWGEQATLRVAVAP